MAFVKACRSQWNGEQNQKPVFLLPQDSKDDATVDVLQMQATKGIDISVGAKNNAMPKAAGTGREGGRSQLETWRHQPGNPRTNQSMESRCLSNCQGLS